MYIFLWTNKMMMMKKKDGYRQRNVRQFLHILASPGYAPGGQSR